MFKLPNCPNFKLLLLFSAITFTPTLLSLSLETHTDTFL